MGGTGKHPSGTIMSSNDLASHQTHKNEQFNELLEPPPPCQLGLMCNLKENNIRVEVWISNLGT